MNICLGDTSAGKTTFINRLVGYEIFVPRTLASTAVVCRIRKSEKVQIKLYTKEETLLKIQEIADISLLRETLRKYTELDKMEQINGKDIYFVDIYIPSEKLQVIDSTQIAIYACIVLLLSYHFRLFLFDTLLTLLFCIVKRGKQLLSLEDQRINPRITSGMKLSLG
jgi:hypothetical protein